MFDAASARKRSASENPATPVAPICRNERREVRGAGKLREAMIGRSVAGGTQTEAGRVASRKADAILTPRRARCKGEFFPSTSNCPRFLLPQPIGHCLLHVAGSLGQD